MLVPSGRSRGLVPARGGEEGSACQALLDVGAIEAASRVAIAAEQRRATVEVAQCFVRIKEIESIAAVEQTRLGENGSTERCRISEVERSKRCDRVSAVAEVSVKENGQTQRVSVQAWQDVSKHAATMSAQVVEAQLRSSWLSLASSATVVGVSFAALLLSMLRRSTRFALNWKRNLLMLMLSIMVMKRTASLYVAWLLDQKGAAGYIARAMIVTLRTGGRSAVHSIKDAIARKSAQPAPAAPEGPPATSNEVVGGGGSEAPLAPIAEAPEGLERGSGEESCSDVANLASPSLSPLGPLLASDKDDRVRPQGLSDFLGQWGLSMYAHALQERGFDVDVLMVLEATEREDMLREISCKPGHRVRFRLLFEGRLPSPSNSPSP